MNKASKKSKEEAWISLNKHQTFALIVISLLFLAWGVHDYNKLGEDLLAKEFLFYNTPDKSIMIFYNDHGECYASVYTGERRRVPLPAEQVPCPEELENLYHIFEAGVK